MPSDQLRLHAVPEPTMWIVLVDDERGRRVREMTVSREIAPTEEAALEHAERCLRGEIAEGLWAPPDGTER